MRSSIQLLIVIAAFGSAGVVRAQDEAQVQEWPRFHVGVAVGSPDWSLDISEAGVPFPDPILAGNRSAEADTGGKLVAGYRPLRVVGVELQFVDFGDQHAEVYGGTYVGSGQVRYWEQESHMSARFQATVLSALLFVPEALPRVDVYGKVGIADLDESISASAIDRRRGIGCPPPGVDLGRLGVGPCGFTSEIHESESAPYVGFGARFKITREAAVRAEYEAIDRDGGDNTTMFSVGIAWEH